MKIFKDEEKRRIYQAQVRELKKTHRRKEYLKKKRKMALRGLAKFQEPQYSAEEKINVPESLSLKTAPEKLVLFLNRLRNWAPQGGNNQVALSFVSTRHIGDLELMLITSSIKELQERKVNIRIIRPVHMEVKIMVEKSGILNLDRKFPKTNKGIPHLSSNRIESAMVAPTVSRASELLWGKRRNPRVQRLVIELMTNSVQHAFGADKKGKWHLLSNTSDNQLSVSFSFIDYGMGIVNSLKENLGKITSPYPDEKSLLTAAFTGDFTKKDKNGSIGVGLPYVKDCQNKNYIENLIVITNNTIFNFETQEAKMLKNSFGGTCYFWKINLNCTL